MPSTVRFGLRIVAPRRRFAAALLVATRRRFAAALLVATRRRFAAALLVATRRRFAAALHSTCALAACTLLVACGDAENTTPPTPSRASFEQGAYPVLLRDCAFPACHASSDRFLQIYGPGRVRLDATLDVYDPATPQEVEYSYERARSMLQPAPDTMQSLLLRKPLEATAGGAGHKGADTFGRNVYRSQNEPGYQALAAWAMSAMTDNPATPVSAP